jgi:hypothetical protein
MNNMMQGFVYETMLKVNYNYSQGRSFLTGNEENPVLVQRTQQNNISPRWSLIRLYRPLHVYHLPMVLSPMGNVFRLILFIAPPHLSLFPPKLEDSLPTPILADLRFRPFAISLRTKVLWYCMFWNTVDLKTSSMRITMENLTLANKYF